MNRSSSTVAVEVKLSPVIEDSDVKHLRRLRDPIGSAAADRIGVSVVAGAVAR
jgi:hypothetical protein